MAPCLPSDPRALAEALLESDAAYFEAGARRAALPGAVMAWMDGLPTLPAAGVVHRVEPGLGGSGPGAWLDTVEEAVRSTGRNRTRIYLVLPQPELETALRDRGYESRAEIGLLHAAVASEGSGVPNVSLRPVVSDADWLAKDGLHAACDTGADGYRSPAREWALMERRKVEAGFMRPFLAVADGAVCGAISVCDVTSVCDQGSLRRLKNLVLHPAWRHRGFGSAVIQAVAGELSAPGHVIGVFAVAGGVGERMYRRNGFTMITQQTEWIGTARP